jgi:CRISPR-associated protein Cas2
MQVLVCYDVATTTPEGRRRLRRVARVCLDYGQRVQLSVFECTADEREFVALRERLLEEISLEEDSLRVYRLIGKFQDVVESYGKDRRIDFEGPLIA